MPGSDESAVHGNSVLTRGATVKKLVIEAALNELVTRATNPNVPYSPEEIADDAVACAAAGASVIHFHSRTDAGGNLAEDVERTTEALRLIRQRCDVLFYPTYDVSYFPSEPVPAAKRFAHFDQMAQLPSAERPDLHVFAVGSVNWGGRCGPHDDDVQFLLHSEARQTLRTCQENGVKPVFSVRELGHLQHALAYREEGLDDGPMVCRLWFSATWGPTRDAKGVLAFLSVVPAAVEIEWFTNCYEPPYQNQLDLLALAMGGHLRTGIGTLARQEGQSNAQLVAEWAGIARSVGREVATAADARQLFGIPARST